MDWDSMTPEDVQNILRYVEEEMSSRERQEFEERMARDEALFHAMQDLRDFPELETPPGLPELSEEELAKRWKAFKKYLRRKS